MKNIFLIFLVFSFIFSCTSDLNANTSFRIEGMTCEDGCAKSIQSKLNKTDGIVEAKVDFKEKLAIVMYDSTKIKPIEMIETIQKIGEYKAKEIK